ncbi:MAG: electron transfer flavoprotein subunit beta [Deltaproteobacteria bacterium]|nr:MAG: electron transfer flavoprotein subunit beta [Deltaproteobacteria bacterium]
MKIVVCIKQVPDTREVSLDPETNTLKREGVQSIMNPYDQHALEEAVRLKEGYGAEVVALTMGPPQAEEVLRQAISCGADSGVLVSDRAFAGADTWATSYTLERALTRIGPFSLVLCGKQAIDGDTAQVGPGLAVRLGIPFVSCVQKIQEINDREIVVERMMDDGYDIVAVEQPALLTVVKDINQPRVPSLKGKMKAKKAEIIRFSAEDINADPACLGLVGSPTRVVTVFPPPSRAKKVLLEGSIDQQVDLLVEQLAGYL